MISRAKIKDVVLTMWNAFRKFLRGKNAIAEYEDIHYRRMICQKCEFLTGSNRKTYRCKSCDCLISLKIMFTTSKCPENKWQAIDC